MMKCELCGKETPVYQYEYKNGEVDHECRGGCNGHWYGQEDNPEWYSQEAWVDHVNALDIGYAGERINEHAVFLVNDEKILFGDRKNHYCRAEIRLVNFAGMWCNGVDVSLNNGGQSGAPSLHSFRFLTREDALQDGIGHIETFCTSHIGDTAAKTKSAKIVLKSIKEFENAQRQPALF